MPSSRLSCAEAVEQLVGDQRRQPERRLVEQQQPRPATSAPGRWRASAARRRTGCRPPGRAARRGGGTRSYQRSMSASTSSSLRVKAPSRRLSSTVRSANVPRPWGTWATPGRAICSGARAERCSCPSKRDRALGRDHPADGPQRGGLAGAVGAEDHDDLALVDGEVDAVQHLDRAVAGVQTRAARAGSSTRRTRSLGRCVGHAGAPR